MLRILYVVDSLMAGGIESQLVGLATGLDRQRFEPHIFCLYGPRARALHFAPQVRATNIPLYTPDLGWSAWDKVKGIAGIISTTRAVRPHIIQTEGYHANLLTRLAAPFLPPTKLIGTVRGMHTAKQLFYERLSHWVCAQMVVNAPHLKTMLEVRAGVPACKIRTIPNGISVRQYAQPCDGEVRQRLAPHARCVLLSLGRISFEKNMHWTVQALGMLKRRNLLPPDVRFLIVGPVQDAAAQQMLDEAICQDSLEAIVSQHPEATHPEDYYHACDVCVLFSPAEGLSNVSIEALAAGRPVIISEPANAAGVIEHGVTGWVVRGGDREHLAETLSYAITISDEESSRMRAACVQRAQEYGVETLVQRYTDLYETWRPSAASRLSLGELV